MIAGGSILRDTSVGRAVDETDATSRLRKCHKNLAFSVVLAGRSVVLLRHLARIIATTVMTIDTKRFIAL
jgi:hypothetical protein